MESYGLDMEDIFDTEADLDDDLAVPPPMPDLEDGMEPLQQAGEQDEGEEGADADVLSKLKDLSKGAAKKKVMRPQPKLDLERLKSNRGLQALPKIFETVKFKGKGHEAEDLRLLMGKLEHWAHRLYPKHPFDDFVERLEKLATKKPVQTCIKRIRLDLDDYGDDIVRNEEKGEEDTTARGDADTGAGATATEFNDMDAEEAYEEMMREERELAEKRKQNDAASGVSTTPSKSEGGGDGWGVGDKTSGDTLTHQEEDRHSQSASKTPSTSQSSKDLTEKQVARMERNRQLAMERRLAKFGKSPGPNTLSTQRPEGSRKEGSSQLDKVSPQPTPSTNEMSSDQHTVDELETMLEDDQKAESVSMNLQLTETALAELDSDMHRPDAQDSQTPGKSEELGLRLSKENKGSSSVHEGSDELELRMNASEIEEDSAEKDAESATLELHMSATESTMVVDKTDESKRITDHIEDLNHNTEKLQLRLSESEALCSESEVYGDRSEHLHLKFSDTEKVD